MILTLTLLLQVTLPQTAFTNYMRVAEAKLGLTPHPVVLVQDESLVKSLCVQSDGYPCGTWTYTTTPIIPLPVVYVTTDFLLNAPAPVIHYTAYHEACHGLMGAQRPFTATQRPIVEAMVDECVRQLLGDDGYQSLALSIPASRRYYPAEINRYWERLSRFQRYHRP
jgi:hypothetical protein